MAFCAGQGSPLKARVLAQGIAVEVVAFGQALDLLAGQCWRDLVACQVEDIADEWALDREVQGRRRLQCRGDVDLQEPGLERFVQEDVDAEELEAGVAREDVGPDEARDRGLAGDHGFDDHVLDGRPEFWDVDLRRE